MNRNNLHNQCLPTRSKAVRVVLTALISLVLGTCVHQPSPLLTGLEKSKYLHLTSSSQISHFLHELSHRNNTTAATVTIGTSVLGTPIEALLISRDLPQFGAHHSSHPKMTVMLIGSQHGMEPSGAEALLLVARELVQGSLRTYLEDMDLIVIPNSNPDGRNANRRVNGKGVNISTDFTLVSAAETKALLDAVYQWQPEVVLDVHESAVLKKTTLARQGFLIDFEAQFEAPTNPNVDTKIRTFSFECLLPKVLALVNSHGLPAQRYVGEITDIRQPITHGGLSLRNIRNMAGMMGSFSFLLENRLDPSSGTYLTPRNIRERVRKQYLCISAFLSCCRTQAGDILSITRQARERWKDKGKGEPLHLSCSYAPDIRQPEMTLPLRRLGSGEPIAHTFRYYGTVECASPLTPPASYIIVSHQELLKNFLDLHHITGETAQQPTVLPVIIQRMVGQKKAVDGLRQGTFDYPLAEGNEEYMLKPGDLIVTLDQPARHLIPLLLEPQSQSSIFASKEYAPLFLKESGCFVYRCLTPCGS